jgi:hypothetical protein
MPTLPRLRLALVAGVAAGGVGADGGSAGVTTAGPGGTVASGGAGAGGMPSDFVPLPTHVVPGPLCEIPEGYVEGGGDPTYIDCAIESDSLSDRDPDDVPGPLRVVAYNVEFGNDHATVLEQLGSNPDLAGADFLLLSEVARESQTSNPPGLNQARAIAEALAFDYAFAVEWDRRNLPEELGEHGVAVLSKYPLGNATQIRHVP